MANAIEHTKGSGNVYADLGFRDAEDRLVKARLAMKINQVIENRGLTRIEAGKILEINQPKVSALINAKLTEFSIDHLIHFLNRLDLDVKIVFSEKPKNRKPSA